MAFFCCMDISINTPAILFPAISLIMLAYTNRFLALSNRVRSLHDVYKKGEENQKIIHGQIKNLRYRLNIIKNMQALGIASFLGCIACMFLIYFDEPKAANIAFALSLILFAASLFLSLIEIFRSTKALELELSDMEGLEEEGLVNYFRKKF